MASAMIPGSVLRGTENTIAKPSTARPAHSESAQVMAGPPRGRRPPCSPTAAEAMMTALMASFTTPLR